MLQPQPVKQKFFKHLNMKAYTYIEKGHFALIEKPKPELQETTDAIVRVTLGSICTATFTSSTEACQELFPALPLDMKWLVW